MAPRLHRAPITPEAAIKTLLGVIDVSYQHNALGDLLPTQVEFATVAHPQQVITWEPETTARLLALFDELYGKPRASSGKGARDPSPGVRANVVKDA
jgi:hypothetical protein